MIYRPLNSSGEKRTRITRGILPLLLVGIALTTESCDLNLLDGGGEGYGSRPTPILRASYGSPAWHPGGKWIAASHEDSLDTDGDGTPDDDFSGIWLVHSETGAKQPLIHGFGYPAWSPDGTRLAFQGSGQILTIEVISLEPAKVDTSTLRQLTNEDANFYPAWSPDGQWIAYDSNRENPVGGYSIWKMKYDGSAKTLVVGGREAAWSPNNVHLIYMGLHREIFRVNINDTSEVVRLTSLNQEDIYATDNHHPRYSPDGMDIAFQYAPSGTHPSAWTMNHDGNNLQKLIPGPVRLPAWSPDGSQIVFVRFHLTERIPGNGHLWLFDIAASSMEQLTFN